MILMSFNILRPSPDDGSLEPRRYSIDFFFTLNFSLWITFFPFFSI